MQTMLDYQRTLMAAEIQRIEEAYKDNMALADEQFSVIKHQHEQRMAHYADVRDREIEIIRERHGIPE